MCRASLQRHRNTARRNRSWNGEHLKLINNAIAKLAVSKGLYYVDLWEVMADENGYLRADLAGSDGLHLLDGSKYRPWLDYLAAHTIYSAHNAQFALADGGAYR